ncbi:MULTISPECIES: single-stranded DNA-binding protein [Psychroflexus]|uniref:Single-stranded DNA-binding protein n=1 Tax=Psychroflexus halocasei TaxID=908615 RepID=A0A1H4BI92_9FLAO|nr:MULTISPECIES: single-stranded DNA-binding protein [Psychroflexus]PJX27499.1 single-stranded DNA-binding protein [Psychroflexus sp. S27]SEA47738.1 single-strand DNA-binding protein [Psychroflexus halocasei]
MSTLKNSVQLMGHLGKDPEVLNLDSGKKLVKFSLATNDNYTKKDGEKVTTTDWHQVVAWGKTAEIIEKYVTKGKEVIVRGKLSNRSYETKEGEKRYITEVNCQEIVMTSASNQ